MSNDACLIDESRPYPQQGEDGPGQQTADSAGNNKIVTAVTFGRFDLFVDGVVLEFSNKKAKELVALCIDRRGSIVSMEDAIDLLWEPEVYDERVKRLYRKAALYAYRRLAEAGAQGVFRKSRGCCYVNCSRLNCDYYRYIEDPEEMEDSFKNEYMFNYSWGEKTLGWLMGYREKWEKKQRRIEEKKKNH